jgi:hypothetical protein
VDGLTGWKTKGELCTTVLPIARLSKKYKKYFGGHNGSDGLAGMGLRRKLASAMVVRKESGLGKIVGHWYWYF